MEIDEPQVDVFLPRAEFTLIPHDGPSSTTLTDAMEIDEPQFEVFLPRSEFTSISHDGISAASFNHST
jgi:hypothetical protein